MGRQGALNRPLDDAGDSSIHRASDWLAGRVDQEQEVVRFKLRVLRLHHLRGETATFEQDWYRWLQLIDAFDLPYAMDLITSLEQCARKER